MCFVIICLFLVVPISTTPPLNAASSDSAVSEAHRLLLASKEFQRTWNRNSQLDAISNFRVAADSFLASGDTDARLDCLVGIAASHLMLNDRSAALRILNDARGFAKSENRRSRQGLISAEIARVLFWIGDIDRANSFLNEARSLATSTDNEELSIAVSRAEAEHDRFRRALHLSLEKLSKIAEFNKRRSELGGEADALLEMGYDLTVSGDHVRAFEVLTAAKKGWEESGNARGIARTQIAFGHLLSITGDIDSALRCYREAEAAFPPGVDGEEKGILFAGLSNIYEELQDLPTAIEYRQKSLQTFEETGNKLSVLFALPRLAVLNELAGRSGEARIYFDRAGNSAAELRDNYSLNLTRQMMAEAFVETGSNEKALALLNLSLQFFDTARHAREIARIEILRGRIFLEKGDLSRAHPSLVRSLELSRALKDRISESNVLFFLGLLEKRRERFESALEHVSASIDLSASLSSQLSNSKVRRAYTSNLSARYELLLQLLARGDSSNAISANSIAVAESYRASSLREQLFLSRAGAFGNVEPSLAQKERDLRSSLSAKADLLTDALNNGSPEMEIAAIQSDVTSLEHQLEEIRAELKRNNPVYSAIKDPTPFDLPDFQANVIDDGSILLEYFLGEEESYLWVVGKNEVAMSVLPGRDVIEAKIDELRRLLDARKPIEGETFQEMQDRVASAEARYAPAAHELSDMILAPVADRLFGKRLIVVADGRLHHFPINALPMPKSSSDDPILLTNEVAYAPSAQTLSLLARFRSDASDGKRTQDLLVFSDPVFGPDDSRLSGVDMRQPESAYTAPRLRFAESLGSLQRLPSSAEEANEIVNIVGGRNADNFTGFAATREHLLSAQLSDYKIIHLATHGLVDEERPELSAVVLSRFDESGQRLDEAVRLQDIYAMKLNADLVVLSACQTASGKEIRGEGVLGLNNAFLQAGAGSVVASLWPVDDHASNMIMRELYTGMADGLSVSSALRKSQLALYRDPQFRSPFFWAAFTVHGDMNRRPVIGTGLSLWWFATLPFLLLTGFLARRLFSRKRP